MEKRHSTEWTDYERSLVKGYAHTVAINWQTLIPSCLCNGCIASEVMLACIRELKKNHGFEAHHIDFLRDVVFIHEAQKEQKEEADTGTGTR